MLLALSASQIKGIGKMYFRTQDITDLESEYYSVPEESENIEEDDENYTDD